MLSLLTLAVLGFAAYRLNQLIRYDSILDGPRNRIELWHARKHESKIRTFVHDLLGCDFCVGWWASGIMLATYLTAFDCWAYTSWLAHGVEWFAVAGIQACLSRWENTLPSH